MVFLQTKYKKAFTLETRKKYFIKLLNDFIFFIFLLKEYSFIYKSFSINCIKNFIYLLTLLSVKYILSIKYKKIFYLNNYNINQIYNIELFYWKYKNIKKGFTKKIEQKVLFINKISRTRKKGIIKRYKAIVLIGEKTGWFGIGWKKSYYLQEAISKARLHAFKNIYQVPLFYSNILKDTIYLHKKSKKLCLFPSSKFKLPSNYFIRILLDFIGLNNITSKIIGIHNIYNILSLILKM